jgi:TrmH family RNA methyltransferase
MSGSGDSMHLDLRSYKRRSTHSYALGVLPTLELLRHRAPDVLRVYLSVKGERNRGVAKIRALCERAGIDLRTSDAAVRRLAKAENCYAVGVFRKYRSRLREDGSHVVLVNPDNMGNLGTIARTMLGYGFRDLAIIEPAADVLDPRTVRASMGALFQLRCARFADFGAYWERHGAQAYAFMTDGASSLDTAVFQEPCSLIFGNEGRGLPAEYARVGRSVRIEQASAIDSLNLAVAVGIALHRAYVVRGGEARAGAVGR